MEKNRPLSSGILLALLLLAGSAGAQERVLRDVAYKPAPGGDSLRLDVYWPAGRPGNPAGWPVVLWLHGGGWRQGSKADPRPNDPLLRLGYAVVGVQYRLTDRAIYPAQLVDCKDAVRFVRQRAARWGLNPDRIGVWGASAGGHLAALLGTTADDPRFGRLCHLRGVSDRVRAVVDECGPTEFHSLIRDLTKMRPDEDWNAPTSLFYQLFGGPVPQRRRLARRGGAFHFASRDDAPFLLLHGEADDVVPVGQSVMLYEKLRRRGVFADLRRIPGRGHGIRKTEIIDAVVTFFGQHLAAGTSPPPTP